MNLHNNKPKQIGDRVFWYDNEWHTSIVEKYVLLLESGEEIPGLRMRNGVDVPSEICAKKEDMRDILNQRFHFQKKALSDAEWKIIEAERHFKSESDKLDKLKSIVSKFDFFAGGRTEVK